MKEDIAGCAVSLHQSANNSEEPTDSVSTATRSTPPATKQIVHSTQPTKALERTTGKQKREARKLSRQRVLADVQLQFQIDPSERKCTSRVRGRLICRSVESIHCLLMRPLIQLFICYSYVDGRGSGGRRLMMLNVSVCPGMCLQLEVVPFRIR